MDWRLISAVTLAGASFSMVAFGAYTLHAADSVAFDADRTAPPLSAPSLMPFDAQPVDGQQPPAVRGVTFVPVEGNVMAAAGNPAQEQPVENTPVHIADLPALSKEQEKGAKVFWNHKHHHGAWRVNHHVRFCTVLRPCEEKRQQVAVQQPLQPQVQQQAAAVPVRHEEHSVPKVALMIGVGF